MSGWGPFDLSSILSTPTIFPSLLLDLSSKTAHAILVFRYEVAEERTAPRKRQRKQHLGTRGPLNGSVYERQPSF